MTGRGHRWAATAWLGGAIVLAAPTRTATADADAARAEPPTLEVVALATIGTSFTLGARRGANRAPPSAEVRLGWRPRRAPWVVAELGFGATVYPELVPTIGLGLRAHPLFDRAYARHLFVRLGGSGLVTIDGFDVALGGEAGVAVHHQRVLGWIGVGADRFVREPRLLVQARVGVGLTF